MTPGKLILFPAPIFEDNLDFVSQVHRDAMDEIFALVCENGKTARRHLKRMFPDFTLSSIDYLTWHKKSSDDDLQRVLDLLDQSKTIGYMSEAGLPCIADPGHELVAYAHQMGHKVRHLPGPSSLFYALLRSGLSGQAFRFFGYLSIQKDKRKEEIRFAEQLARKGETQIFMETPYRNQKLLETLINSLKRDSKLCVACHIDASDEFVSTRTIVDWASLNRLPDIHKKPTLFLLGI